MGIISNKEINDYLEQKKVPHANRGYMDLLVGIRAMLDGKVDRYQMQSVYDYVASKRGVTSENVSRSMRKAIRLSDDCLPNREFMSKAVDELLFSADKNHDPFEPTA